MTITSSLTLTCLLLLLAKETLALPVPQAVTSSTGLRFSQAAIVSKTLSTNPASGFVTGTLAVRTTSGSVAVAFEDDDEVEEDSDEITEADSSMD
ncbi:hypothetical protein BCR33DRAFT_716811 [Rhizoclosmatium globosum]|uniref:Uncharacterized protein n=1 Tax=Rhizoclosmatium globosum TaxID=329046 RepID=A0A1Y2CD68_9FUNG|nr:hypothetical protein BCR33DRAFT_716811 [Rhizoclosmatium globosum]|eukprot:ORY44876.1 hypothetical protein BCR33DRAFT_716811 [Rhizoclosmatium globosum]